MLLPVFSPDLFLIHSLTPPPSGSVFLDFHMLISLPQFFFPPPLIWIFFQTIMKYGLVSVFSLRKPICFSTCSFQNYASRFFFVCCLFSSFFNEGPLSARLLPPPSEFARRFRGLARRFSPHDKIARQYSFSP